MKNTKTIERIVIISVALLFIAIGFVIYLRYENFQAKDDEVKTDDFYNSGFLFNNNYIKVADELDTSKIEVKLSGAPKDSKIYYSKIDDNCYELAALKGNVLYYDSYCGKEDVNFKKISTNVSEVYVPSFDKEIINVVNKKNITSNFIINTKSKELKYISYKDKILGLYNNIEYIKPYFDYLCPSMNYDICKNYIAYVNFDKELIIGKNSAINDNDGNKLIVQDLFGILEIDTDKEVDFSTLDLKKLKKYNFKYTIYILDQSNYLYKTEINSDNFKTGNFELIKSNDEVKTIEYDQEETPQSITFTYSGGIFEEIKNSKNTKIEVSTIYDRNLENKKLIKE